MIWYYGMRQWGLADLVGEGTFWMFSYLKISKSNFNLAYSRSIFSETWRLDGHLLTFILLGLLNILILNFPHLSKFHQQTSIFISCPESYRHSLTTHNSRTHTHIHIWAYMVVGQWQDYTIISQPIGLWTLYQKSRPSTNADFIKTKAERSAWVTQKRKIIF